MKDNWALCIDKLYCALELQRRAVGVRIIKTKEEYDNSQGITLKRPLNYCQMVASAAHGNHIKAKKEDFNCQSGPRILGLDSRDLKNSKGENWARLGLYDSPELAQTVREGLTYVQEENYGVELGPIETIEERPDVIIIACSPYNAMRITQGYAYHYGMPNEINMLGNQAICLECTARPYVIKKMNVSLLCIGTRHRAGWKDDEMAIGIPAQQFENVVDGLMSTMNQMENDTNKKIIEEKLLQKGIPCSIKYGYNYYMDC